MLVVMKPQATPEEIQAVCEHIQVLGFRPHPMPGAQRTAIGITGNQGAVDQGGLEELSGVAEVIRVTKPWNSSSNASIEYPRQAAETRSRRPLRAVPSA